MAKHDIKAREIQVESLLNQLGKILAKTNITYGEARPLGEFDLVYRKYIDAIVQGIANPKTALPVSGPLTINWHGFVPDGGQTFAQKHGNNFDFQAYRTIAPDPDFPELTREASYTPTVVPSRDAGGNIVKVEFADVFPGRIVII